MIGPLIKLDGPVRKPISALFVATSFKRYKGLRETTVHSLYRLHDVAKILSSLLAPFPRSLILSHATLEEANCNFKKMLPQKVRK